MTILKAGDTVTITGFHPLVPNTRRRWWQFWKPRSVPDLSRLTQFVLSAVTV